MDLTADDVRTARLAADLTQPQAAGLVHLARWQTWQDWERGVSPPDVARVRLFMHLAGLERIPFDTTRAMGKSVVREAAELGIRVAELVGAANTQRDRPR